LGALIYIYCCSHCEPKLPVNNYTPPPPPPPVNCALITLILLIFSPIYSYADDTPWYEGFFIEGSALYYFAPEILKEYMDTKPGFRGALGYEYKRFLFSLESGYSHIIGTNPLVKEINLVPLVFKFGYELPLFSIFGLQANISAGTKFSKTIRYETALDYFTDNLITDNENSLLFGARFYATISPWNFLKIYAGGGIDVIFETDGLIPLPLIEAGISIKPAALVKKIAVLRSEKIKITVKNVCFEANSVYIEEEYIEILEETGQILRDKMSFRVTLLAYYAPDGPEKQVRYATGEPALSMSRAVYIKEYLTQNYGIDPSRIKIEFHDAHDKSELYRCVEIIIR